jgi:hypothetical protein
MLTVYVYVLKNGVDRYNIFQCGKPFFSNTGQNGEWTETSTRQNEIELAMFGECHFF